MYEPCADIQTYKPVKLLRSHKYGLENHFSHFSNKVLAEAQ